MEVQPIAEVVKCLSHEWGGFVECYSLHCVQTPPDERFELHHALHPRRTQIAVRRSLIYQIQ
jgi:hypothetical protein